MKEYSIPMAVFDLLPVVFFIAGTMTIAGDMKQKMTLPAKILFVGGSWIVCAAGLLKALYKLAYSTGLGDPAWMSRQFFYNQAFGFLLAGVGLTLAVTRLDSRAGGSTGGGSDSGGSGSDSDGVGSGSSGSGKLYSIVPIPVMALVGIMVAGLAALDASLCFLAAKLKKRSALVLFIVSFFLCLGMGYLSSKNFEKASMNWIAEGVNAVGQLAFLAGCEILHEAGLDKL
ncbi:MAG: hypothetical protein IJX83_13310 [Lachnospiraceae bacterium]|nr:hypothetical protein [Lachnospiraceae bacterium]